MIPPPPGKDRVAIQEISVLLADDCTILRGSLREVIDWQEDMRTVGE